MNDLLLHQATAARLKAFMDAPAHALLLTGAAGSGKTTLASYLAASLLGLEDERLASHPYYFVLQPEKGTIPIESVRALQKHLQLKTVGTAPLRRAVVILDAHTLRTEAQNALLKTLEEPPVDTVVILTAPSPTDVLPTIRSRAQHIAVLPIGRDDATAYFTARGHKSADIAKAYALSEGLSGLMTALLDNNEAHELVAAIDQAKKLLTASAFDRLATVDALAKSDIALFLDALRRVVRAALQQAARQQAADRVRKLAGMLETVDYCQTSYAKKANAKLLLTHLSISL